MGGEHGDDFGAALRRHRLAAGLTQEALAERAGLSARGIQDLERGVTRPLQDTLQRLLAALPLMEEERVAFRAAGGRRPTRHADPEAAPAPPRHHLPSQLTSFLGRERELAAVAGLLPTARLLTLTGAGGCGKTRLALRVASDAMGAHADGAWLVELAALADPALVPAAVAAALGVREAPGRPLRETLTAALRGRHLLLVLDNCEHLLDACAGLVEALLRACPGLRVLATSREPLAIAGEVVWRVPSLPVPPSEALSPEALARYDAARLFVERAQAAQPGFALTHRTAPAVARVCRRLDGLPWPSSWRRCGCGGWRWRSWPSSWTAASGS